MKNINKGSLFPIVSVFIVVLVLVASVYWFGTHSKKLNPTGGVSDSREIDNTETSKDVAKSKTEEKEESGSNIVVEKKDNVLEEKENVTENKVDESDEDIIETLVLLLAKKHEKKVEDIKVTISERGNYIVGGVRFRECLVVFFV